MSDHFSWVEHKPEIIAFIFAILAAIILEIAKRPIRKSWQRVRRFINKQRNKKERTLHETEISNSIKSNFTASVPPRFVVDAIKKHGALTTNDAVHYTDAVEKRYHVLRRLRILPLINGAETFFRETCREMASAFVHDDTDLLFLSLKKETNEIFANEFVGKNWPGRIKWHEVIYKERRKGLWSRGEVMRTFKYEDGDSLEGTKVILLEALLVFPETLTATIEWLKKQGAMIKGIAILFNGADPQIDFQACGISPDNVSIGWFVDLKIFSANNCECKNKRLKVLTYNDY
jgi:hypothetical protein